MSESLERELPKFLGHNFLRDYSLYILFIFGSLLIYHKTASVPAALLFSLVSSLTILTLQTVLLRLFLAAWNRLGMKILMSIGLCLMATTYLVIFYLPLGAAAMLALAVPFAVGANCYYMPYHVLKFVTIGESKRPGRLSSYFQVVAVLGAIAAALTGVILGESAFGVLFIVAGVLLFLALALLWTLPISQQKYTAGFPAYLRTTPLRMQISYMEFSHELSTTVVPLVVLFAFGSLGISIWVSALASLGTIFGVWAQGVLKDKQSTGLTLSAGALLIIGWVAYPFAHDALVFALLGIGIGFASRVVQTAIDASLGRDAVNNDPLPVLFAAEFTKHVSRGLALVLAFGAFLLIGTLSKGALVFGALFELPRIWYALSALQERRSRA